MPPRRQRPTTEPALKAFGSQMKRYRTKAGVVQESIAARTHTSVSFVSLVETGKRPCKREFTTVVDELTGANGALLELWEDLYRDGSPVPSWFLNWSAIEGEAESLITWQHTILPGLLQTEAYARQLLTTEEAVKNRLDRQTILTRSDPPAVSLTALLSPTVLSNPVGTRETMQEQLAHLCSMAELPNITIQIVIPTGRPVAVGGAFVVATHPDLSAVAYLDTAVRGITTDARDDLSALSEVLRHLQSRALPENMSIDMIRKAHEEL
ncbi:helix-turn-helix domain-containing protein [Actinomadura harenae]|uniref:XRE family transcriptional regulator n=1 Tax=Actinomadura harenae TaxID=2483351 RepID=A0A3M2LXY7_9ACTN|nr:helix-turn-helix transcriptional regulator [Actinomadura harenae]RMI42311.1 XRE family transcriptional regulator [Actinomadura harenae]